MIGVATLTGIWDAFRDGMPMAELVRAPADDPQAIFYLAVLAVTRGDYGTAARLARTASAAQPADRVYRAAARYLATVTERGQDGVYDAPAAFAAFIRGGGNVALYAALSTALSVRYRQHRPTSLLDIGTGDGRALLPALSADVGRVDLVEPAAAMLEVVATALRRRGIPHTTMTGTVQDLVTGRGPATHRRHWALVQSTFALHNLAPPDRLEALGWVRRHTDRLLVAEFDVPAHDAAEPAWFQHVVDRYRRGLAEYDDPGGDDAGLVAQGFLMPVLFGYFDPANPHHEQPLTAWADDLGAAGFRTVLDPVPLHDYWWAPAYLLEAVAEGDH